MIRFYLKIILRSFLRNEVSSVINFIGLSIAFSLFILLVLFANNELTTDSTHKKATQIYRLLDLDGYYTYTGTKFGPYLNKSYPEIEEVCRTYVSGGKINFEDISIQLDNIAIADSNYFRIFTHKPLLGKLDNSLNDKHSIVLTESTSKKLFGDKNPIGV